MWKQISTAFVRVTRGKCELRLNPVYFEQYKFQVNDTIAERSGNVHPCTFGTLGLRRLVTNHARKRLRSEIRLVLIISWRATGGI